MVIDQSLTSFNPLVDEVFFIGAEKLHETKDRYYNWLYSINIDNFDISFQLLKTRWIKTANKDIFWAMANANIFYKVLSEIAFNLAWIYYKDIDPHRGLRRIYYQESREFIHHYMDKNGSENITDWIPLQENVIWNKLIILENEKGNESAIPFNPSSCKYYSNNPNPKLYECLFTICSCFPEMIISPEWY